MTENYEHLLERFRALVVGLFLRGIDEEFDKTVLMALVDSHNRRIKQDPSNVAV